MTPRAEPLIADHGLIGDLQTAALVSTDGEIDWLCMPRFDSPSVFGSLIDTGKGGYFWIHPAIGGTLHQRTADNEKGAFSCNPS